MIESDSPTVLGTFFNPALSPHARFIAHARYIAQRVSDKLKALRTIAGKVQEDGRLVSEKDVSDDGAEGATEREIHDAV